jgi:Domain of unknown function (DUF4373)
MATMARKNKGIVDYFPHYVTHGKTLMILRNEFGNDGYAFWFSLLELLCRTDGQFYDYNKPADWRLLLAETHVTEEKAESILKTLVELEAIDQELYDNKVIWIQNLVDNLETVFVRRATGKPVKPSYCQHKQIFNSINVNNNDINVDDNPQSKQEETKQNKTRGNDDDSLRLVTKTFENCGGVISTQMVADQLKKATQEYGPEIIVAAFKKASDNGHGGTGILSYCRPIFVDYKTKGIPKGGNGNGEYKSWIND